MKRRFYFFALCKVRKPIAQTQHFFGKKQNPEEKSAWHLSRPGGETPGLQTPSGGISPLVCAGGSALCSRPTVPQGQTALRAVLGGRLRRPPPALRAGPCGAGGPAAVAFSSCRVGSILCFYSFSCSPTSRSRTIPPVAGRFLVRSRWSFSTMPGR